MLRASREQTHASTFISIKVCIQIAFNVPFIAVELAITLDSLKIWLRRQIKNERDDFVVNVNCNETKTVALNGSNFIISLDEGRIGLKLFLFCSPNLRNKIPEFIFCTQCRLFVTL